MVEACGTEEVVARAFNPDLTDVCGEYSKVNLSNDGYQILFGTMVGPEY